MPQCSGACAAVPALGRRQPEVADPPRFREIPDLPRVSPCETDTVIVGRLGSMIVAGHAASFLSAALLWEVFLPFERRAGGAYPDRQSQGPDGRKEGGSVG